MWGLSLWWFFKRIMASVVFWKLAATEKWRNMSVCFRIRHLVTGTSSRMLVVSCFLYLILKRNMISSLWLPYVTVQYVVFFMQELSRAHFKPYRHNDYENTSKGADWGLKRDWWWLVGCILFCLLHFCISFFKFSYTFHPQYVNIDCFYIKSGHNKI